MNIYKNRVKFKESNYIYNHINNIKFVNLTMTNENYLYLELDLVWTIVLHGKERIVLHLNGEVTKI